MNRLHLIYDDLAFAVLLIRKNLRVAYARRLAFFLQTFLMLANNLLFFSIWWIFFHRFKAIQGWTLSELTLLCGIVLGAFGFTMVFAGGIRTLGQRITTQEIETLMTQPRNVLLQLLCSNSIASGWGDIFTSLVLLAISGYATWEHLPLILLFLGTSTALFISVGVIIYSLPFWLGEAHSLTHQLFEFVLTFSVYPQSMFSGVMKWVLLTFIPAGFIGCMPVEVIQSLDYSRLPWVLGAVCVYASLASWVFRSGLRRYQQDS